ncbi:MAG: DNA repair protein RecN [Lachnospiraceae bacterium]
MLTNVHVKNLALIDETEIYFKEGLNILTGETGAGKSIIIGSINLALGGKAPKDIVREGTDYGLVELVFESESNDVMKKLQEADISCEDGQIIISRKIVNGRSTIRVNGETVSAAFLKELSPLIIDIYGQHDNQYLINKSKHLGLLDDFGGESIKSKMAKVDELYKMYKELSDSLKDFDMDEEERNKEISFLEFQINDIEEAALRSGEDDELEEEYKKITHSKKIAEALGGVYSAIGDGIFAQSIERSIRELSQIVEFDCTIKGFYDILMDMEAMCRDLSRDIWEYMEEMSFDEERVHYVEERLDTINRLKLKYDGKNGNGSIDDVETNLDKLRERLEMLRNADTRLAAIKEELGRAETSLRAESIKLTAARKKAAGVFEKKLTEELKDLNFNEVSFKVDFEEASHFTSKGIDVAEFYISTNAGEKLKPLSDVASGGELSRIMLGLKTIMAGKEDTETLIFDEIDTGISGRTAQRVSEKLKLISKNHQVMAITHLPQIAAMADSHFLIEKSVKAGKTVTDISELDNEKAVMELARMLGGKEITDIAVENAREMKKMAVE